MNDIADWVIMVKPVTYDKKYEEIVWVVSNIFKDKSWGQHAFLSDMREKILPEAVRLGATFLGSDKMHIDWDSNPSLI